MLAYLNALPSSVLTGRYAGIPYSERTCDCDLNCIEPIDCILLRGLEFLKLRQERISPLLSKAFADSTAETSRLLSNVDGWVT